MLLSAATSFFEWHNLRLPEDLHFLRSDFSLVLGCVALEEYAWMELSTVEFERWNEFGEFSIVRSSPLV